MGADIVDVAGAPVATGTVGELVLRQASNGMTKSLWKDDARYIQSYWSALPDVWMHGDFAKRGEDGLYYILGRSDDTIKVSGKRVGPSEIEGLLIKTGKVSEAAAVGVADSTKGSAIVCACVPTPGVNVNAALATELANALVAGMGASYRPRDILFVTDLPRTRNLKIMRRVLRALLEGSEPGDLSSLSNPETVEVLRAKIAIGSTPIPATKL
jgi:acetyl-CoA synthetase